MKKVLIVEDDPFLLDDLCFFAVELGLACKGVDGVSTFLPELDNLDQYSLILLDLSMDTEGRIELNSNQLAGEV